MMSLTDFLFKNELKEFWQKEADNIKKAIQKLCKEL